jgi:cytochrome P450
VHFGRPASPGPAGTWFLFRHDDVAAALRDARFVRELRTALPDRPRPELPDPYRPFWEMASKWILFRDPPDHTRLRALVATAFTPRIVQALAPRIADVAEVLLDEVEPTGTCDLIRDYAFPLPVIVIAELLGVPGQDRIRFRDWSVALAAAIDLRTSPDVYGRASDATRELTAYLRDIVAERRAEPRDDLVSALITAESESGSLDEEELIAMCILLLVAGHETTVNLIGNGVLALLRHPEQLELLRSRPDLVDNAVEELLRFDSSVQFTFRFAREDIELRGRTIPRGDQVGLILGSANRDPEQFPEPDRLDVTRTPLRHLAFGMGIHFCLGAPLARLEARLALETILRRLPGLRLVEEPLRWREGIGFRGLDALSLRW